ncbi:CDP-glycerol glycerophosphotransferase family protein [Vibrio sp. 10N.261.52.C2]|uniref:CDP-glycerol glycerophosphotransferase family protein n=1 Tax=Vibrio sp. 10N.261.52.C2 TaxID=3229681 RepID=UPI00354BEB47
MLNKIIFKILKSLKKLYVYTQAQQAIHVRFDVQHSEYDIVFYMSGGCDSKYQYDMWGPIIQEMKARGLKVVTVFRSEAAYRSFAGYGECRIFVRGIAQLIDIYNKFKVGAILYPNNRVKNFQSLSYNGACHIFINHGESEKSSMYSNQAKAYDLVFVAGNVALERYRNNLSRFDEEKFIKVGRPQLDFIKYRDLSLPKDKRVILYAPTWEGTHSEMNYSSIGIEALEMVKKILRSGKYSLLYKPHPSLGSQSSTHKKYHDEIVRALSSHSDGFYIEEGDINSFYQNVEFSIFDNSSVIVDYLVHEKPYCVVDMFSVDRSEGIPELAKNDGILVSVTNMPDLYQDLDARINNYNREILKSVKVNYLGDLQKGDSTNIFIHNIKNVL